jgi:hypothetical protein
LILGVKLGKIYLGNKNVENCLQCRVFFFMFRPCTVMCTACTLSVRASPTSSTSPFSSWHLACSSSTSSPPSSPCPGLSVPAGAGWPGIALIKKKKKIFLLDKEIQKGAAEKSYMRKGFLIYEEMSKYLVMYDEAFKPGVKKIHTLIKNKIKFSSCIRKYRREQLQSRI